MGPYGETAWTYRGAGWAGVLPLPPGAKWPPPGGYTGWAGVEPSGADVQAWIDGPQGEGNVALRLPRGIYGLDVDDYASKTGGSALAGLVQAHGPLPATWVVSSRDDGVSGIRLFRAEVPAGRRWRDEPAGHGAGIEAIHFGHRYAVAWPSIHPDTGRKYTWCRPDGLAVDGEVPVLSALPELPAAWIEGLSEPGEVRVGEMAGHDETVTAVTGWRDDEPCPRVREARDRALRGLAAAADGAALHPVSIAGVHELVNLGHEGHAGCRRALAEHYALHVEVRSSRGDSRDAAESEWWRAVRGAIGKLPGGAHERCDCDLWSGDGLLFDPTDGLAAIETGVNDLFDGPAPLEGEVISSTSGEVASPSEAIPIDLADALIARMLTPAELRDRPPPSWLIKDLLTVDSASWLIAEPASYKSFVALDWAGHVAAGREWLGRPVLAGPVVYLVAEGVGGMGPRIRAWEQRNGPMSPDIRFLPMPVQIARPDHWAALVEACRRIGPVLIILDTQARITVGIDENDNTAMGEMVAAIDQLKVATGACVLVVHHTGRSGGHARGASAIDGAQDVELKLTRTADRRVTLNIDKSKNAADDVRIELELFLAQLDDGNSSLVVGPPLTLASALEPDWRAYLPQNQAVLTDVMADIFPAMGATKAELKAEVCKRPRRKPDGTEDEPMGDSSFRRAWDGLVDTGKFVRVDGTQRYVLETSLISMDGGLSG